MIESQIHIPDNLREEFGQSMSAIKDHLVMTMGDDVVMINKWLQTPKPELSGQTPIAQMHSQDGCLRVIAILRKILEQDSRIG